LKKNYNKPCPCCELAEEYRQAGKEDEYKSAKASRRVFYNVLDARAPEKGVMIFATSHYLFEHELIEEAIASGAGNEPIDFAVDFLRKDEKGRLDLGVNNGKVVAFRGAMTKMGNTEYLEFKSFSFEDHDVPIPREIQSEIISLDEVLSVMSYDDMQSAVYGQSGDTNEDEDEEGKVISRHDRDTEKRVSSRSSAEEDEEQDNPNNEHDEGKKVASRPSRDEPREADEATITKNDCPYDHNFPSDWDKKPECAKCKVWDKCGDELELMKKDKK
jgi:hypothetical protein